jgi:hypothetical protein
VLGVHPDIRWWHQLEDESATGRNPDMGQGFGVLLLFKNNLAIERPFYLRGAAGAKSQIWNQNRRKTSDSSSRLESDECTAIRCMIVGARKAGAKRMI